MAKTYSYLRRLALGVGIVMLLAALGLGLYSNTEAFRQMVRQQLVAALNDSIHGSVSLERIDGSLWGDVTLHDVRLRHQELDIAQIPQLKLSYALLPLLRGQLRITRAEAVAPVVRLVRDEQNHWNIAAALAAKSESPSTLTVLLKSLALRGGDLDIRLDGAGAQRYRFRDLSLASRLTILPKGIEFDAGAFNARLATDKVAEIDLNGSFSYHDSGAEPPMIKVTALRLATAASQMQLSGQWVGFDNSHVQARLLVDRLAPADVARFVADWPVRHVLTGQLEVKGALDALALTAEVAAAKAKLSGNLIINVAAPTPSYRGTIKVAGFDAAALLDMKQFAGVLDGDAKVAGAGFALSQFGLDGDFTLSSLQVKQWALGNLRLNAQLRDGAATLQGDLKSGLGSADWRGHVTLAKVPSYEFDLTVHRLDIKKVAVDEAVPEGVVSFKGKIAGAGITLAALKGQTNLEILPSSLGAVQIRGGELNAAYGDGRIRISRASLRGTDSTLTVNGEIGTAVDQRGKLDYDLRSENLTPWLALLGQKGGGSMALTGNAQGSLTDLNARGILKTARLRVGDISAGSGAVEFALTRKREQKIPAGNIIAHFAELRLGAELQKLDATVNLQANQRMQIDARGQDKFSRAHALSAELDYSAPDKVARLNQLSLGLPDGNWSLVRPATVTQRGENFVVENFTLRNQERRATLDGQVSLRAGQALNLTVDHFPLEALAVFLPRQPKMTGLLALQAKIGGSAAAPQISGNLKMTDSTIGGEKYAGVSALVNYRERHAELDLTLQQDSRHSLNAIGKLPLLLSWRDGWRAEVTGPLDMRIKSAGLSLAFLNAYTTKTVAAIGGAVSLDVTARGALMEPRLSGSLRLTGGKVKLTALNVDISDITTEASFDQRRLTIENFSARSAEGRLNGSGLLTLKQYQVDNFQLALEARRWPAIQTRRYQGQISGNIELTGPLSAPKLAGKVNITEANLRPDLAFLAQSSTPVKRDETIVVVDRDGNRMVAPSVTSANNGVGDTELFKKLILDLDVRMDRNVWIRHSDAVAELRGQLRATKTSGQQLQLVGLSEIIRGWAIFQGRRFEFTRGEIRFIGGAKVDPALDILARYRLPQYTVDAQVGGTAETPTLDLRSDPALDQADILALLVFGKPTKDLSGGEQASLQQGAVDIGSGFAAAKIGSAVAEAIGLDALGFDLGDFNFSSGRVGYGRYIGRRTYVTVSQELAGERGEKAPVEYQFSRDWKLESSTTSDGTSGADIIWHKRY